MPKIQVPICVRTDASSAYAPVQTYCSSVNAIIGKSIDNSSIVNWQYAMLVTIRSIRLHTHIKNVGILIGHNKLIVSCLYMYNLKTMHSFLCMHM